MDQEEMVNTGLDSRLIGEGRQLLGQLDKSSVKVDDAFWLYYTDEATWRLVLYLPEYIGTGPRAAYQAVQAALQALSKKGKRISITLGDIAIVEPDTPTLILLRQALRTGPGINNIRFKGNVINGQLIEDAYIYRLM